MRPLSPREATFVAEYALGKSAAEAARIAGYQNHYARRAADKLLKRDNIAAAIEEARTKIGKRMEFNAEIGMAKLDECIAFARETKNATAMARAIELQLKMAGLLIERVHQLHDAGPSLIDAIAEGKERQRRDTGRQIDVPAIKKPK